MNKLWKLAILTLLFIVCSSLSGLGQQNPGQQNPSQPQPQTVPPSQLPQAEPPPHVDKPAHNPNKALETEIRDAIRADDHMAYSRDISVHVSGQKVTLKGTVVNETAKDQAGHIAEQHAPGRKIVNHIKVNANTHPGSGM